MFKYCVLIAIILALGLKVSYHSDNAMAQCQKTHSYDTCFQILNR